MTKKAKPSKTPPLKSIRIRALAYESETPGLFIHVCMNAQERLTVTHGRSGRGIANFPDNKDAERFARMLGKLGDWDVTSRELKAKGGILSTDFKQNGIRMMALDAGGIPGAMYRPELDRKKEE